MAPSKHALLGPSSSAMWLGCPPSARLTEHMPHETSVYAEEGTKAHYVLDPEDRNTLRRAAELVSPNSQPPRKRRKQT